MSRAFLITGAGGMLGTALSRVLAQRGAVFEALSHSELDITDPAAVADAFDRFASTLAADIASAVVINAAAYTNVERAEERATDAYAVNERGARLVAEAAAEAGLGLVHVSTDFVFDGEADRAYVESDAPNPLSVYGASKLAGERAVAVAHPRPLIVRTSWVFGPGNANFPAKILELARTRDTLQVVTDEVGSPTYTLDLAQALLGMVDAKAEGLYHMAGAGSCTRFELARATLEAAGLDRELVPVTADAFPTKARRPRNSVLDCSAAAALGVTMRPWEEALSDFVTGYLRPPGGGPA